MIRSMSSSVYMWFACSLVTACTGGDGGGGATADGPGVTGVTSLSPPEALLTDPTGEPAEKLDLPGDDTAGEELGPRGCEKVDFLFVIDNSNSMADEQNSLIASFPGFIAAIEATVAAKDYHIMAISTDNGDPDNGDSDCDFKHCICAPAPTCCKEVCAKPFDRTCNGIPCADVKVDWCDFQYGAGRHHDQYGSPCGIADGRRYMLASQPELTQTFACAAGIGVFGSGDERPIQAALAALGPTLNGPGGCNEGFLRDDAILVLVIITDEEDTNTDDPGEGSPGEPADWYNAVVAAKGGVPTAAVVLGLVGDGNRPGGLCPPLGGIYDDAADPAPRLQAFVEMFPRGVIGSVCASDYTPFFLEAVSVIDHACEEFVPVG